VIVIGVLIATVAILLVRRSDLGKPPPPANPVIAVLPFENLSGDPEQEYFSDGLAEEMLDRLGQVPGLRVIARSSSFGFKGKDVDVRRIAERLGVTTVLEGSVQRSGGRLKLAARLIDGATGQQVWSGSFDREIEDVFEVQDELAAAVVAAVAPAARGDRTTPPAPAAADLSAYDSYLLAKQGEWQRNPESTQRAVSALERSIEIDPTFAPAHAQLALALLTAGSYSNLDPEAARKRAEAAAHRALALDLELPAAHLALALVISGQGGSSEHVLAEIQRALELNPNYAAARYQYSRHLPAGREEESRQWLVKTLEVDPLAVGPRVGLIHGLHRLGDDRRRNEELARFDQLHDSDADALSQLARTYLRLLGDPVRAADAARRAMSLAPSRPTPGSAIYLHRALLAVGAFDEAERLRQSTDWRERAPATWAFEQALAAGTRPDLAGLEAAVAALRALPPDPARAAALMHYLTLAGKFAEVGALFQEASKSYQIRTYTLTGLDSDDVALADLWSLREAGGLDEIHEEVDRGINEEQEWQRHWPQDAHSLLNVAALESLRENDGAAVAALTHAFAREALPGRFLPHLPWFARLAGQPEFDRLVSQWSAARAAAKDAILAARPETHEATPAPTGSDSGR
jgi:TolB-like protein